SESFVEAMPSLILNCQLKIGIGNFAVTSNDALKTFDGLVRPENHPVTLAGQVEPVGPVAARLYQPIEYIFGASNFKSGAEGAGGVNERNQVLRVALHRLIEKLKGFVKAIEPPQSAGPLQLR